MKDSIDQVARFHEAFGHLISTTPTDLADDFGLTLLRSGLIHEELSEYQDAIVNNDIVGIADALGDLLVVVFGAVLVHGMQDIIQPVFNEIMRANMSKLGADGKPVYRKDGKILKGSTYSPPQLEDIINASRPK